MIECAKCKIKKDSSEFGIDKQKKSGFNSYCKECIKRRSRQQREQNPIYAKEYAQKYREKNRELLRKKSWLTYYLDWDKRAEIAKKSYERHKEKIAHKRAEKRRNDEEKEKNRIRQALWRKKQGSFAGEIVSRWKKRNPQKAAAHTLILWAIRTGLIKKPSICQECKMQNRLEGHHEDYLKPLEVQWLCKNCHSKKHRKYR